MAYVIVILISNLLTSKRSEKSSTKSFLFGSLLVLGFPFFGGVCYYCCYFGE